ncbi:MAG: CPBP family intramembrane metalloprotease [Gemmatimonadetes bacterium]|nr:CPBP family intramembrane metalloprotease [Gemmatimonadota bacterium]
MPECREVYLCLLLTATAVPLNAQGDSVTPAIQRPPWGAEFKLPALSFLVPGVGQYAQHAAGPGAAFSATAVLGMGLFFTGDTAAALHQALPRSAGGQQAFLGAQLYQTAGSLSAYDSFRRSLPSLRRVGKHQFLEHHEPLGALFTAPFDLRFLGRWTTWLELAYTGVIAVILVSEETRPGKLYQPYKARDAAFGAGLSLQAGIGEEALFRGWLYPVLHQAVGRRMWLSNSIQATTFGLLHAPNAGPFALVIAGWAWYQGWLTRKNGWSIRESIFHHFWYDVAIVTITLATDERAPGVTLALPPMRFRAPRW